jgi:hypothetical protein
MYLGPQELRRRKTSRIDGAGMEQTQTQQQIAILHLGFHDAEDYHEAIEKARGKEKGWADAIAKRGCAPPEEGESEGKGGADEGKKTEGEEGEGGQK